MFNWLRAKKSEEFDSKLAMFVANLKEGCSSLSESKRVSKTNYDKNKLKQKITRFKQEDILNFYKIAKLLNKFKLSLKDAGCDESLIDNFAKWILICLQSKSNQELQHITISISKSSHDKDTFPELIPLKYDTCRRYPS